MKRVLHYFPLWKDLLFLSFITISYLAIAHLGDASFFTKKVVYTNKDMVKTMWTPSSGGVQHYLLEISDTRFFTDADTQNSVTMVKNISSPLPSYQIRCEHNHSYKVRAQAISPTGISSPYSEESALLICDQKDPQIELDRLPSPAKRRHPSVTISGTFYEPNLDSITINDAPVSINLSHMRFSAQINLDPGKNNLTVRARDLAGNATTKTIQLDYSPVTIVSLPSDAKIYWNGNYAYLGIYSGNTPQSFNQAVEGKQTLRLTYPGFNDYYGIIDFSDLTQDTYTIALTPFSGTDLTQGILLDISLDSCAYPFVEDYNLDGKKDLLLGARDGKIVLFTNTGKDSAPRFSDYRYIKSNGSDIDVGTYAAPFMVDYNNDATQDLLVGSGDGHLLYYPNQGSTSTPVFTSPIALKDAEGVPIATDRYCTPCVVDWNEDLKKDLLLGSGSGTILVYLNRGSDSDPLLASPCSIEVGGEELNVGSFAAPFVADWNGDGKKDLLVGDDEGYIHLYLNTHNAGEPEYIYSGKVKVDNQDLTVGGPAIPFLIDWNQDGKKDLLVGSLHGYIYLFES